MSDDQSFGGQCPTCGQWYHQPESPPAPASPIPMVLHCPECKTRHIDDGEFATKVHHTHSCQGCGLTWRPAVVATVGVHFLPGFKNEAQEPVAAHSAPADLVERVAMRIRRDFRFSAAMCNDISRGAIAEIASVDPMSEAAWRQRAFDAESDLAAVKRDDAREALAEAHARAEERNGQCKANGDALLRRTEELAEAKSALEFESDCLEAERRNVGTLSTALAEAREELRLLKQVENRARNVGGIGFHADLIALGLLRAKRNPMPTGGDERACASDEGPPRVGDTVRIVEIHPGSDRYGKHLGEQVFKEDFGASVSFGGWHVYGFAAFDCACRIELVRRAEQAAQEPPISADRDVPVAVCTNCQAFWTEMGTVPDEWQCECGGMMRDLEREARIRERHETAEGEPPHGMFIRAGKAAPEPHQYPDNDQRPFTPMIGPHSKEVTELFQRVDILEREVFKNHVGGKS